MDTSIDTFKYNKDFTPEHFIINTNVGINTTNITNITSDLEVNGTVSVHNLELQHLHYNNNTNSRIQLLNIEPNHKINTLNLNDSSFEESGTEWSISNENIKLTLRNINDNTRLYYKTNIYDINNNLFTIQNYFNTAVTIKYLYILNQNNEPINSISIQNILNSNVSIESSIYSSNIQYLNNYLFKLTNFITIYQGISTIILKNLVNYKVQIIGTYDYYAGSMWNKSDNTVFYLNNVGLFEPNNTYQLYVNGNMQSTNININNCLHSNTIHTNNLYSNNLDVKTIHTKNSDYLHITNNNINIKNYNNNNLIHFGSKSYITNNSIYFNNINVDNIISTQNIVFKNNQNTLEFNESNVFFNINHTPKIHINTNNITLNDSVHIGKNNNLNNINNPLLNVYGNLNIVGNLSTHTYSNFIYKKQFNNELHDTLNTTTNYISDLLHIDSFLYTETLTSTSINVCDYFKLPFYNHNNHTGTKPFIYYNTYTDKYMIYNTITCYEINTEITLLDFSNIYQVITNNASDIIFLTSKLLEVNILETTKLLNLDTYSILYNVTTNTISLKENNNIYYLDSI